MAKETVIFSSYTNGSTFYFSNGTSAIFLDCEYETDDEVQIKELRGAVKANGMIVEGRREKVDTPIEEKPQPQLPAQQLLQQAAAAAAQK